MLRGFQRNWGSQRPSNRSPGSPHQVPEVHIMSQKWISKGPVWLCKNYWVILGKSRTSGVYLSIMVYHTLGPPREPPRAQMGYKCLGIEIHMKRHERGSKWVHHLWKFSPPAVCQSVLRLAVVHYAPLLAPTRSALQSARMGQFLDGCEVHKCTVLGFFSPLIIFQKSRIILGFLGSQK